MFKFTEDIPIGNMGSYPKEDVLFLLKDLSSIVLEQGNEDREKAIQSGVHYSEMLPVEYKPSDVYMALYLRSLEDFGERIADAVALVSERIYERYGNEMILVSLARAGIPAAILIKRYLKTRYDLDLYHYTISIIRGKGIDENAIKYMVHHHPDKALQFIDGWTGKGAITKELDEAIQGFNTTYKTSLENNLAVIADPGDCVSYYGTRADFLIPSACLNSTVSGLVSRTVHRTDLIGDMDFHGAKYYSELESEDVSNAFIERICSYFDTMKYPTKETIADLKSNATPEWKGMKDVQAIMADYEIENIHFVKPGIGETTRVLLRRIPWKILLREDVSKDDLDIQHIVQLAAEKNIPIERFPLQAYKCCGIIQDMRRT